MKYIERSEVYLNKKALVRIILIVIIAILVIFLASKMFFGKEKVDEDTIEIVQLGVDKKMKTADYLVLSNTLYQKGMESTKTLNQTINEYRQGSISEIELQSAITKTNKQLTYYYLVAIQSQPTDVIEEVSVDLNYEFYLMRKGTEELLKFNMDKSTLRLSVGQDLLQQAIASELEVNTQIATEIVRYAIVPEEVVVSNEVWDKEYAFLQDQPDMVIFKDIEANEKDNFSYYLRYVNDTFMLVSWEIQNMYLSKLDYTRGEITQEQLKSKLDGSGYIINTAYDDLEMLEAPEGLSALAEDTEKTMRLYRDAMLEIHKFRMTGDTKHFDNAMIIINQADVEAGRIGEFIYAVRQQYGL